MLNRRMIWIATVVAAVTGSAAADDAKAKVETGLVQFKTTASDGERTCALYVPPDYTPKKKWPLIVFLHGMGERGNDGLKQTTVGIGHAIEANADRFPCLVVMPQCSPDYVWTAAAALEHIDATIETVLREYSIDKDRVVLTGLSMGGFGSFHYGALHPEMFSCVAPVCGGGQVTAAETLAKLPMWVFHGADDTVVPPARSQTMVEAIRAAGGDVKYTEYPGVGHNSWDNAYGDPEAIKWMLSQKRK
ncbi:MAG: alpha/beta hydrolase [Candidatus Hydrogenedentota bacterium]